MSGSLVGLKKLTKNDLSWLEPGSKSHQAGINLPLRQFRDLFPGISDREGSPRVGLDVRWHDEDGDVFAYTRNDVVWYSSKRELRLLHVGREGLFHMAEIGDLMVIERVEQRLEVHVLPGKLEGELDIIGIGRWIR
tara:strand:- start:283 stop:690 length:408 start_codon:yes stop_codon:yes gene_type:complete